MMKAAISEKALRELVSEILSADRSGLHMSFEPEGPVPVNPVVDPSAALTDPSDQNFLPQTRQELDIAIKQVTNGLEIDQVPAFFKAVKAIVNAEKESEEANMKKQKAGVTQVENAIRAKVREVISSLNEAELPPVKKIPYGVHGDEYMRRVQKARDDMAKTFRTVSIEDEPEDPDQELDSPKKRRAYKKTALGGMSDVGGASFDTIAKELNFSIAGAKQAVDKSLEKLRFMMIDMDPDDLEILVLQTMNDYINMLSKTGSLSAADVKLMKDHPDIVRELDGFREFLGNAIRRKRKAGQKVVDPLGEAAKKKDVMLKCPDCGGKGWDEKQDKDCELCAGHGQISKRDLYGEHKRLVDEALSVANPDEPAWGPPCDSCGSDNTEALESVPSMVGYGMDSSWKCNDCGEVSHSTPLGRPSRMQREAKYDFDPGEFPKRLGSQMLQFQRGIMKDLLMTPGYLRVAWVRDEGDRAWQDAVAALERKGFIKARNGRYFVTSAGEATLKPDPEERDWVLPLGQPSRLQREARLKKKNFKGCRNEWHAGPPVTMAGDVTVACPTCGEKAPEQFLKMAARKSKKK